MILCWLRRHPLVREGVVVDASHPEDPLFLPPERDMGTGKSCRCGRRSGPLIPRGPQ